MTPEEKAAWLDERCGKLTASRIADAMSFLRNGQPGEKRTRLLRELLAERLTGSSVPHVVTPAMEWGLQYEDEAKARFTELSGLAVRPSRFYNHPSIENFGATPDGELDDEGLLETKCPTTAVYLEWKLAGVVPEQHKPQMAAQLACTGKRWCGFVAYDPRIKDERKQLFMAKYEPTAEEIQAVEAAAEQFLAELDAMFDLFVAA